MLMPFSKLEGLGNDFILIKTEQLEASRYSDLARKICNRFFGVGADGVILFHSMPLPTRADFSMRIFNADGSEAELSGNGLRCLAAHLWHHGLHRHNPLRVDTRAGLKAVQMTRSTPPEYFFEVEMGNPILDRNHIPLNLESEPDSLVACELAVGDTVYKVTITSMGNPHCSIFLDDFGAMDWERVGSRIEAHPAFPNRTNVEFVKVKSRQEIEVRFWERGVGKTYASGTGSCAAVVASVLNGYTDREVQVHTLGGGLEISWQANNSLCLKGPARFICHGEYCYSETSG